MPWNGIVGVCGGACCCCCWTCYFCWRVHETDSVLVEKIRLYLYSAQVAKRIVYGIHPFLFLWTWISFGCYYYGSLCSARIFVCCWTKGVSPSPCLCEMMIYPFCEMWRRKKRKIQWDLEQLLITKTNKTTRHVRVSCESNVHDTFLFHYHFTLGYSRGAMIESSWFVRSFVRLTVNQLARFDRLQAMAVACSVSTDAELLDCDNN